MTMKSFLGRASFGITVVCVAFVAWAVYYTPRQNQPTMSELEEIHGLSTWRTVFSIVDCSQYNTGIVNDPSQPSVPGQPAGPIISVDRCEKVVKKMKRGDKLGWCLECDGNGAQFSGAANKGGGSINGMMDPHLMSCGDLYFGRCQPDGVGGYTCNNSGSASGACADSTEYWIQATNPPAPAPAPVTTNPSGS